MPPPYSPCFSAWSHGLLLELRVLIEMLKKIRGVSNLVDLMKMDEGEEELTKWRNKFPGVPVTYSWSKEKMNELDKIIYNRLNKKNQDIFIVCVGDKGSGKSWSSIRRGQKVDPNFSIRNVVSTLEELDAIIKDDSLLPRGSMLVIDEGGIRDTASSKEWWSETNKRISELFQTIRYKNWGFIMTVPSISLIEKSLRTLAHMKFRTIVTGQGEYFVKPTWLKKFSSGDVTKIYDQYPTTRTGSRIKMVRCKPPSLELIAAYEAKAETYKDQIRIEGSSSTGDYVFNKIKKKILKHPNAISVPLTSQPGRSMRNALLRERFGLSEMQVRKVRPLLDTDEEVQEVLGRS